MEEKRFLKLENDEIVDTFLENFDRKKANLMPICGGGYCEIKDNKFIRYTSSSGFYWGSGIEIVEKTDNILDFVEIGDLVKSKNVNFKTQITFIDYNDGKREFNCDQIHDYWFSFNDEDIVEFWKLQPNRNYKRYIVKGE